MLNNSVNYYTYHIGDYRTATAHLSLDEDATYKRLLDYQYDKECPIPDDPAVMARRLRSSEKLVSAMLSEFFTLTDQGWVNQRVWNEVGKHQEFIDKQKHNGRKGGRQKTQTEPTANPTQTLPIPNTQYPIDKKAINFENLPEPLNTDSFKEAWKRFVKYRTERKKPIYQTSMESKWKQMESWGVDSAIQAIENTISNGWQGVFPPHGEKAKKKQDSSIFRGSF
jgi:uncharacterized protein YdaU (DUF1376 family)